MPMQPDRRVEPNSTFPEDPFRSNPVPQSHDSVFNLTQGSIELATIIDVIPHARCYKLQSAVRPNARGYALTGTSHNTATGANDISLLQVDTVVLVYYPRKEISHGFILGAIPGYVWDNNLVVPPVLIPGSDVGITEPPFQYMLNSEDFDGQGKGIENFAGGAPADNLPGDWGVLTEYGVGVLVSKMVALLRAGDNCNVMVSYLDQLLRLHGYNFEQFTSSSEHRIFNDEQEVHDVNLRCKFPWEALGVSEHGNSPFELNTDGSWKAGAQKAYYEPKNEKQTGLWRDIELRGYLGDLLRSMVIMPDTGFESTPITYDDGDRVTYSGLSEITRGSNGSVGIRSAKEILLAKYVKIPVPQQKTLPDDNQAGDWYKNYKASNVVGDGATAPDMADFSWSPNDLADLRPALLLDYAAWVFNFHKWENLLAHKKDWRVNEESEATSRWTLDRAYIEGSKVTALDGAYWAEMPRQVAIDIDSRVKSQNYYESMSCLSMLDDGSVVIEDGWGSSIVMHRGNIQLCCAGDVFLRPGRSFYAFAPKDAMLRAGGSIDLTATTHDIRIKAECNLQLLAGNDSGKSSKRGGILLESRCEGMPLEFDQAGEQTVSGGIVLKCRNSDIAGWANNIYLGTKQLDSRAAGTIMLSADEGKQNMLFQGRMLMRDIKGMAIDRFSQTRANLYTENATILDTQQLIVRGSGFFTRGGGLYAEKNIGVGGDVIAEGAGAFGGTLSDGASTAHMVAPNDGATKGMVKPVLQQADNSAQEAESGVSSAVDQIDTQFQGAQPAIGSYATAKVVNFSLRTDDDYAARDFKIFAARWQQLLAEAGGGHTWEEREVTAGSNTTYPYPGRMKYQGSDAFYPRLVSKYFPLADGLAVDRGDDGGVYKDRANATQGSAQSLNQYGTTVTVD